MKKTEEGAPKVESESKGGRHDKEVHQAKETAALIALIVGCTLTFAGLVVPPLGEIHPTVLVAFGEALTFSGAALGFKYHYDYKRYLFDHKHDDEQ